MLLFGHIGITLGVFFGASFFVPRLKTMIDPRYLVIGALLPDLVDKPLGMIVFASTISNGRMISHTLISSLTLFLIGLYLYNKKSDIRVITLALGSFFHIMEDQMWITPQVLFWPLLIWRFPKDPTANGSQLLFTLFKESITPEFSYDFIPEIIGVVVIVILALNWLKERLHKINSKDEKRV